jgi:ABC-type nitrate/sulfonate/bicarbonate transport system substrate-binding protein
MVSERSETMKKILAAMAVIAVVAVAVTGTWYLLGSPATRSGSVDSITVGGPPLEQSAFLYIASDQGFFAANGLNVTIRDDYPSGVGPVSDVQNGLLDISVSAEYPLLPAIFNGSAVSVIGTIDHYQNEKIIGRKDRGIMNVSGLAGERIGLPRGTIAEFILGRFLDLHGMSFQDVTLVDVPGAQSVDRIVAGDVDAVIAWQPNVYAIENRLAANGTVWPAQSSQLLYTLMAGRDEWIASHQDQLYRFLKSLAQAEGFFIAHPAEVKAIVERRLNYSDAYMAAVWSDHQFSLALDQSLVIAMNDEARWMINNNLTSERTVPDFNNHIYMRGLEEVKPESVDIR